MLVSSFQVSNRQISLRIGSIFDPDCEALVMTPQILAGAAEHFGHSVRKRYVLGEMYYRIASHKSHSTRRRTERCVSGGFESFLRTAFEPFYCLTPSICGSHLL
jgi:hypothetical protein